MSPTMAKNVRKIMILSAFVLLLLCDDVSGNDSQNINRLLNNQVIVSRQIMCVLEKSPCDQLGRQLKGKISLLLILT